MLNAKLLLLHRDSICYNCLWHSIKFNFYFFLKTRSLFSTTKVFINSLIFHFEAAFGVSRNSCKSSKGIVNATSPAVPFFDCATKSFLLSHPIFTLINANARDPRFTSHGNRKAHTGTAPKKSESGEICSCMSCVKPNKNAFSVAGKLSGNAQLKILSATAFCSFSFNAVYRFLRPLQRSLSCYFAVPLIRPRCKAEQQVH